MCRALSSAGADIDFIVPYTADHSDINFMNVVSAIPAGVQEVQKAGMAYDSFKFVDDEGREEWVNLFDYHKVYEKSVDRLVKLAEYDVIHAFDWLTIRPAMRAKQLTGKPLIVNIHALEYDRAGGKRGNPLVWEIEYQGMMMADRVVTVSQFTKDIIVREYHIPEEKIEVIHNSFDLNMYSNIEGPISYRYIERMKAAGYGVVMYVGRLTVQKGLHNLIRAFARVVEKAPKTLLLVVGSGEQEIELIEMAAEYGIGGNVIFAGFQRGKEWRDAFGVSSMTIMPSVSEPFGLTPFESAAFGVPALVSKQSGVAEVMRTALKVDFWDTDEMANQMLAVTRSPELQQQLSEDSYREIQALSWGNTARKFMAVYRKHAVVAA
jgi:glycosyltransferase involved in cell wall biosynthesis